MEEINYKDFNGNPVKIEDDMFAFYGWRTKCWGYGVWPVSERIPGIRICGTNGESKRKITLETFWEGRDYNPEDFEFIYSRLQEYVTGEVPADEVVNDLRDYIGHIPGEVPSNFDALDADDSYESRSRLFRKHDKWMKELDDRLDRESMAS